MSKYEMKPNSTILLYGKYYTNETLTDEVVEKKLVHNQHMLGQVFFLKKAKKAVNEEIKSSDKDTKSDISKPSDTISKKEQKLSN